MTAPVIQTTDVLIVQAAEPRPVDTRTSKHCIYFSWLERNTDLTEHVLENSGATETVHTFPYYLSQAATSYLAKGAHVLISSQTPNNPDESGVFVSNASRFVDLAKTAATNAEVDYVDHNAYTLAAYKALPVRTVDGYFPNDHTHTAPQGADLVAKAFIRGLVCGGSLLGNYVKNGTKEIEGACLK